jgi:DHA1 family tetracycline resistance protein-like MFS transporter
LNAVYGFFILPESLPPERRASNMKWGRANPMGALRLLRSHYELLGLASVSFLNYLAHEVYLTVFVLYATLRYNWNERDVGNSLAVVGITTMIVSAAMIGPLVRRFGERATLFSGLFLGAVGFALFGASPKGWIFMAVIPVNALWGLAAPPLQTLMTRRVSVAEQGELQGAVASLRGIAMIVGPGIFSTTFAFFIAPGRSIPGAPWFLSSIFLLIALSLAWVVAPRAGISRENEPSSSATTLA